ncbi:hypothetical protein B0H13DRAFT_1663304, partial [Mycena leptocephala]
TNATQRSNVLESFITTYNFALLDGRRVTPTSRSSRHSAGSAIVQVRIGTGRYAGEIRSIFSHQQTLGQTAVRTLFVAIAWMQVSDFTPLDNPKFFWDDFPELGIETWELDTFQDPKTSNLPIVMPLMEVHCQLSRGRIEHTVPRMWITTTMDRVR